MKEKDRKKKAAAAGAVAALGTAALLGSAHWAYEFTFKAREDRAREPKCIPNSRQAEEYRDAILSNVDRVLEAEFEPVHITSQDGLKLFGRYYLNPDGAEERSVALIFHGYRSPALRDGCGGFQLFRNLGYDVLLVDQRAHGESEGDTIYMGLKERYDCLEWTRYVEERFGKEKKMLLVGVSMGATTVLMASSLPLPEGVKGIMADCGYSSVSEIIKSVSRKMKLPSGPSYRLVRLGARVFGHFDTEECSAEEALKDCKVPVLFIHGEGDDFVPARMSRKNYAACASEKEILLVPGADHGLSFNVDPEHYRDAVNRFCKRVLEEKEEISTK